MMLLEGRPREGPGDSVAARRPGAEQPTETTPDYE